MVKLLVSEGSKAVLVGLYSGKLQENPEIELKRAGVSSKILLCGSAKDIVQFLIRLARLFCQFMP